MRVPLGGAIDVLAVIVTVTGVAATLLGFGALQINEGLHFYLMYRVTSRCKA